MGLLSALRWSEGLRPSGRFGVGVIADAPGVAAAADAEGGFPFLRIWYPVDPGAGMARGAPAFLHKWFTAASPALAAAGPGGLPILVGIPGWDGVQVENTALVRELVSHGFVVVTLEYPLPAPAAAAPPDQRRLRRPMDFSSGAAFDDTVRRGDELTRIRAFRSPFL